MNRERFRTLTARYPHLRVALVGDFCLDRYLEIDPALTETSIETGLPVHNVVRVRAQPGAAGTILNNLVALGVGAIHPVGFCGEDGEGWELRRALAGLPGVRLDHFLTSPWRRTFTYCKPLVLEPGQPPRELNRLDSKNWTPTPPEIEAALGRAVQTLAPEVDAIIVLDQVDQPDTGVVTRRVREVLGEVARQRPERWILADSRRGLRDFPPVIFKMNAAELAALCGSGALTDLAAVRARAHELAARNGRAVFVTLAERGAVGAEPSGRVEHVPALPVCGPTDIVGAGDAVTANLACALAAGADVREALELAMAAASHVIHQLGTTGSARVEDLQARLKQVGGWA